MGLLAQILEPKQNEGNAQFFETYTPVDSNHNVMIWLPEFACTRRKIYKSTKAAKPFIQEWLRYGIQSQSSSHMNFSRLSWWSIHELFLVQVWTKTRTHQSESTSLRQCARHTLPWFMLLICQFQYADFFICIINNHQIACAHWNLTIQKCVTVILLLSCFRSDHLIPLPLWSPWIKSSIEPPGVHGWSHLLCQLPSFLCGTGIHGWSHLYCLLESMAEISHSASCLMLRDWNTSPSQEGTPIYFAALLRLLHCCFLTCSLVCLHVLAALRWTKTVLTY
jgi:hypothetical protein